MGCKPSLVLSAVLLPVTLSFAGGWFTLSLGQPSAHSDPRARDAAFVVSIFGCAAEAVKLEAVAEGLVNGERRSIVLRTVQVESKQNKQYPSFAVAVPKAWPAEGTWLVRVTAEAGWRTESALVAVTDRGIDRARTRTSQRFTGAQVDQALREAARVTRAGF